MRKLFLLLFIVSVYTNYSAAQSPIFRKYTTEDGLPSSETYSVVQDKKGYMWFATDRGLVKFDGYNFRVFTTADGMPDNTVFELFVGDDNSIWFKTVTTELGYIKNDTGYSYKYNHLIQSILPGQILSQVAFSDSNQVWFSRWNLNLLTCFNIDSKGKLNTRRSITDTTLLRIFINKKGQHIVTGGSRSKHIEVYLLEKNKKIADFQTPFSSYQPFVCASKKGNGSFVYVNKSIFHITNEKYEKIADCGNNEVLSISSDEDDNIYIGYRTVGFERFVAKNGYTKDLAALNNTSVSSICPDNEGGCWFTTLENGIYYLPALQLKSYTEEHGLNISKVLKIGVIEDNVWAIASNNTVLVKNKNENAFSPIKSTNQGFIDIKYDNKDSVYIIQEILSDFGSFLHKKIIPLMAAKRIHVGPYFAWTQDHMTLSRYAKDGKLLEQISTSNLAWPTSLIELEDSSLLMGTVSGLYKMTKGNYISPLKGLSPLLASRISDIKPFKDYLLIATIGQGIVVLKKDDYSVYAHLATANGLSSMVCNVITIDSDSVIWVGTNRGLSMLKWKENIQDAQFSVINNKDGIPSNEINDICVNGNDIWLATAKGISIIPRQYFNLKSPDIPIYIERVTVNGKPIDSRSKQTLAYNQNNVNIFFTGLSFTHSDKLQYKYRISGDTNWYYTSNRSIVFNGLQPGTYTFEVMVIKPDGQLNPKLAKYSFTILSPFWQTWWFISISSLLLLTFLVVIIYKIITIRKEEEYKKVQLDRKLAQLELEAIKAQINPHFIYNCLNSIQFFNYSNDYVSVKKYFGLLARLIRQTMKFSHETFITLDAEVNYLSNYLELEKVRFKEKLNFHIDVSSNLSSTTLMPAMLVQPYVENALKHGIANLESNGNVWIKFSALPHDGLLVVIEDNGPGVKTHDNDIEGIHFGSRLTEGRVSTYNQLFGLGITIKVIQDVPDRGLRIEITIPAISTDSINRKNSN